MRQKIIVILGGLLVTSVSLAGTPDLKGGWSGEGFSVLPDGSLVRSEIELCIDSQYGGLFSGAAISLNYYDPQDPQVQYVLGTGYIDDNKRVTASFTPPPGVSPIPLMAVFDGKWTGSGISGVVRDPIDGATSTVWFSPDRDVQCPLDPPDPE
jgi:hypothetical protein